MKIIVYQSEGYYRKRDDGVHYFGIHDYVYAVYDEEIICICGQIETHDVLRSAITIVGVDEHIAAEMFAGLDIRLSNSFHK